ncbi:MAG: DUF362 domain-containing protein [Syntrophaceae bacterium]
MAARVYYSEKFDTETIRDLFSRALADSGIGAGRIAIKVHFGEKGNTRFVQPDQIRPIADLLRQKSPDVFVTDANTLYRGMRLNAHDHLRIAREHGFEKAGVPIVIADGEKGEDEKEIEINKKIFRKVKIAARIAQADAIAVVSHFKGHMLFSFGGAIKNLGMGCGSRAGKLEMHSKIKPSVGEGCILCDQCVEVCPAGAINTEGDAAFIDHAKCIGCARCIAACEADVVSVPWQGATAREVIERCAEYACGAARGKKIACITFVNKITSDCDCMGDSRIIGRDVGIVASADPVACEQASYDLALKRHNGRDVFKDTTGIDGRHMMEYAESIGLGTRKYELA